MDAATNVESVASHLRLGRDATGLDLAVAAVNSFMRRIATPAGELGTWGDDQKLGATMLAARVYRRRNSPAGVETIGDMGPTYVSRYDPDLEMLLGFGQWQTPRVG